MEASIAARVEALRRQAEHLLRTRLPPFETALDLRGLAAGRCVALAGGPDVRVRLRFNKRLAAEPELLEFALNEAAPHEVAHAAMAVLASLMGRRIPPHGREWLELCRALGGSGDTTHRLPLPRARRHRQFEYRLADGTRVWLGAIRHGRLQAGHSSYFYRRRPIPAEAHTGRVRRRR